MALLVVEFLREGYEIRMVFWLKMNFSQKKSLTFANWCDGEVSIFYVKNHPNISDFFSVKNTDLGAHYLLLTFFDNINF